MNFTYEINLTTKKIMHLVTHLNVRTSRTEEGRETGITKSREVRDT